MGGRSGAWWASVAAACSALACSEGTSLWILEEVDSSVASAGAGAPAPPPASAGMGANDPDPITPVAGAAGDAGPPSPEPDAGTAGDAAAPVLPDAEAFASVCDPQISVDNRTADGSGALFDEAFPMPGEAVWQSARQVCALLYKTPDEVPVSPPIGLVIEEFFGIGEIGITAPVIYIRLSSLHMESVAVEGGSVRESVLGSLHYLLAIDYELDDEHPAAVRWVIEGLAFWVRYRAGYASIDDRSPGGRPTDDYKIAGFFFDWLDRTYPDAVYRLNQSLDPADGIDWSERVFEQITGKDLATLWNDYQASL